jgi:hypothetical protein
MTNLYKTIPAGFSQDIDGIRLEPLMYQPTPEGLAVLCAHYSRKYDIDLRCINLELHTELERGDKLLDNFNCFKTHYLELFALNEGQSKGIILCYKQNHVVPVLITQQDGEKYMMVFDSSSGARIKGYFPIAMLFPETAFFLNTGTRQADGTSCFTDAVCVLKEALQIDGFVPLIKTKVDMMHRSLKTNPDSRFKSIPPPSNFSLFRMPEKLLLTAQRSDYLIEAKADLNVVLRDGRPLREHREHYRIRVSITRFEVSIVDINSYLFRKTKEHRNVLEQYELMQRSAPSSPLTFKSIEEDDNMEPDRLRSEHLTSPAFQDMRQSTQPSSRLLLDFLAAITPIAALLTVISLITENYPMAITGSLIALTGFFGQRLVSEKFGYAFDQLETNAGYVNSL